MKAETAAASILRELVTFNLDQEEFGLDVSKVLEVNRDLVWTPVPGAKEWICGAANLRGRIVTIVNIRQRLGYEKASEQNANTVIIVSWRDELAGLLVDSIADVVEVEEGWLDPPPKNLPGAQQRRISGVYKKDDRLIAIIDLDASLD